MLRSVMVLLFSIAMSTGVFAADFAVDQWRGKTVLTMTGPITQGDANRFSEMAPQIPAAAHGVPVLLLDSPGGSVDEAMHISQMMESYHFHTVIPDKARCASACASIIFLAGTYRTVEPFGLLGQHSCSLNGRADQACNDAIALHAVTKGVSHGSVAAFVTYTPPDDILWFSREAADGWGLTRYAGERESGFEKSEPHAIEMIMGTMPPAQSAWRIDFFRDGFRAFVRPSADHERELQLNILCMENYPGALFIMMDIKGDAEILEDAVLGAVAATDLFRWSTQKPVIEQLDSQAAALTMMVPLEHTRTFLAQANDLRFRVMVKEPYETIGADTILDGSRDVLMFAANNCATGS